MSGKLQLAGLKLNQLTDWMVSIGEPGYRARQVRDWLIKGCGFEEMRNLPEALCQKLSQLAVAVPAEIIERHVSRNDGTEKLLFRLLDSHTVEGVLMRYHHGITLCLSTQVGCAMGCAFCASTLQGKLRDLTVAEMAGMAYLANNLAKPEGLSNIVLMGSGEPLDNYEEVLGFLRLISSTDSLNIGTRHLSLSTCGLPGKIRALAEEGLQVTLSVSLHASNDAVRKEIMPIAKAYPLNGLIDACRYYIRKTGRRVVFEYVMIRGVNDRVEHARELASLLRGMQAHVNLIPLNEVKERNLLASDRKQVEIFLKQLTELHISATVRRQLGNDIFGACGQLRAQRLKTPLLDGADT